MLKILRAQHMYMAWYDDGATGGHIKPTSCSSGLD